MQKIINNKRGSYTIEAAIVFTFIFLLIITFIFACILICQKFLLQKSAIAAASNAAFNIESYIGNDSVLSYKFLKDSISSSVSMDINKELNKEFTEAISSLNSKKQSEKKLAVIKCEVYKQIRSCILKPKLTNIQFEYYDGFINDNVKIKLQQDIIIPLGFIKDFFDGNDKYSISAEASSAIVKPADNIRNIDMMFEYSKKITQGLNIRDIISKLSN